MVAPKKEMVKEEVMERKNCFRLLENCDDE